MEQSGEKITEEEYEEMIRKMSIECDKQNNYFIAEYVPEYNDGKKENVFHVIMFPRGAFGSSGYELYIRIPNIGCGDDVLIKFKKEDVENKAKKAPIKVWTHKDSKTPLNSMMISIKDNFKRTNNKNEELINLGNLKE